MVKLGTIHIKDDDSFLNFYYTVCKFSAQIQFTFKDMGES